MRGKSLAIYNFGMFRQRSDHPDIQGFHDRNDRNFATAEQSDDPTIILGDLNGSGRALAPLYEAGFTREPGSPPTVGPRFRRRKIDHVLVRRGVIGSCWTIRSRASDHLALVALVDV